MQQPMLRQRPGSNQCQWLQGVGIPMEVGAGAIRDGILGTHLGATAHGELHGMGIHQQQVRGSLEQLMRSTEPLEFRHQRVPKQLLQRQQKQNLPSTLGNVQLVLKEMDGSNLGMIPATRAGDGPGMDPGLGMMELGEVGAHGMILLRPSLTTLTLRVGLAGVTADSGLWHCEGGIKARTFPCTAVLKRS